MTEIVILGASGHGREVEACVRALPAAHPLTGRVRGFLDDDDRRWGTVVGTLTVFGGLGLVEERGYAALLGVGYPEMKLRVLRRVGRAAEWPPLVHPAAVTGDRVAFGQGSFVQAGCVLTADINVGEFATINVGVTISHDGRIGRLSTVSPGAHIGGNVSLGEGTFVGIGATVVQGRTLGDWSVIGAGAVVVDDVPENAVVAGVPARVIATRKPRWQND